MASILDVMLSMKSTDGSLSTISIEPQGDPAGDEGVIGGREKSPVLWWDWFGRSVLPGQGSQQVFDALNKAVQHFPLDVYRSDPFLLKIWLAFLEAHL